MATLEGALPVLGIFPFTSLLETDANPSRAFIVDVAGGSVGERQMTESVFLGISRSSAMYQNKRFLLHHQA
jgi:hypothetical protein